MRASHILITTDFSTSSVPAFAAAKELASRFGARLSLVHVHDPKMLVQPPRYGHPVAADELEEKVEHLLERERTRHFHGLTALTTALVEASKPADAICEYAAVHQVNLIVMATHGRTGLARMLIGSVAEAVVQHAPCSVLTVRAAPREDV